MSRAYQIRISESVTKTIHVKDGLSFRMELLDVLAKERMVQLLKDELSERGFTDAGEGIFVKHIDDIAVEVDTTTGEVTVRISAEDTIEKAVEKTIRVYNPEAGRAVAEKQAVQQLEREVDQDQAALQRKITDHLEQHLGDIRAELDKVSTKVVAGALKQKASELGEIEEITEDEQTGNMVIRVRV